MRALGLLSNGSRPKGHDTHNALFFSTGGLCPSSRGKILYFKTLSMENCRLLMRICSNASVARNIPMLHSMRDAPFEAPPLYIWGVNL